MTATATAVKSSGSAAGVRRRSPRFWVVLRTLIALVVAAIVLFPLYWMVVVAFSPRSELFSGRLRLWPEAFTTENIERAFASFPVLTWFGNSVAIALTVSILTVTTNLLAGYAFAHLRFRGSTAVLLLAVASITLPLQVIMVSLFRLVTSLDLYGTYWAVILPTSASAVGILLARQFLVGIPRELMEAARIDGAGHLRTFVSVVLPLSRPVIAVLFFLSLLGSWNDFAWPLIALKENRLFTLPIGLLYLQSQNGPDYGTTMAFALVNVAPMVVLFLLFQRWFVQGFARTGLR